MPECVDCHGTGVEMERPCETCKAFLATYRTTCSGGWRKLRTTADYESLNYAIGTYREQIGQIGLQ